MFIQKIKKRQQLAQERREAAQRAKLSAHLLPAPYDQYAREYSRDEDGVNILHMNEPFAIIGVIQPTDRGFEAYHMMKHLGVFPNPEDAALAIVERNEEYEKKYRNKKEEYLHALYAWMKE